ncbi:MAG: ATP-binding cassette domain-containing protein [Clostridiales bacterium]|nr:ATP-binding cassette domain-containing protein [Clostridiales bacterium]
MFNNQIDERNRLDQEAFEQSFFKMSSAVLGKAAAVKMSDERIVTKNAIDSILKYYHFKPVDIPSEIEKLDEQIEYALRPYGMMDRNIKLTEGWYTNAFGPILGKLKADNTPIALIPGHIKGYYYMDPFRGVKVTVNRKTAHLIDPEAFCFYKPLPLRKLRIIDLLFYIKDCISTNDIVAIGIGTLLSSLFGLAMPRFTKAIAGPILLNGNLRMLICIAISMVCMSLASQVTGKISGMLTGRLQTKTSVAIESAVMMRVLALPPSFFNKYSPGELTSRSSSVGQLCSMLMGMILSTGFSSLTSLLYVTQIFAFAPTLVVPSVLLILVSAVVGAVSSFIQIKISRKQMEFRVKESGMSYSLITGIQKIKLSGSEKRMFARWANLAAQGAEFQYNPPMILKINNVISTAISLVSNVIFYYLAIQSGLDLPNYLAFTAAYNGVNGAFSQLTRVVLDVASIRPVLDMAKPFLETEPESAEGKEIVTKLNGKIELNNICFRYTPDTDYIIDDLSLKIKSKEYIAIVGKTGCGKSTLIRLLLGFEKPEHGAVYYDGKDLEKLDKGSLRRKIGTVMQSSGLFQGTIYSNIAVSSPDISSEEVWEACEISGIADDIRAMPMGLRTIISEGGGGISGGQRQRILIARAVVSKPKILIFDEATSALDNKTQKQVAEALDNMGCTRIVIAHRLSTIKNCDRILVLDKGKIIEEGNYDELMALGGYFAELVERQRLVGKSEITFNDEEEE